MKRYKENKERKKSWSIKLDFDVEVSLTAVDSYTGKHICRLIYFNPNGKINNLIDVQDTLEYEGYDPYEHHNTFDCRGALIIE